MAIVNPKVTEYLMLKMSEPRDNEVLDTWTMIDQYYNESLWHQLTECLRVFVKNEMFKEDGGLVELYENLLAEIEMKLNPLSLVEIVLVVATEIANMEKAIQFISSIQEKVKNNLEARVMCMVAIGRRRLEAKQMDVAKELIEEARGLLDMVVGVSTVHAKFYDLSSGYHQFMGDHAAFYHDSLRFLGCINLQELSQEEKCHRALSLSVAAMIGEGIFNFGELLCQGILEGLKGSDKEWLIELLQTFNEGNLQRFNELRPFWEQQVDLFSNQHKLGDKIRLLSLMELVFKRHAHERTIDFVTISEAAQVDLKQVEPLVMKALSLGLVKGTIDEIDQTVNMTWVQPRVLDQRQVVSVREKVFEWTHQVRGTIEMVEESAPEGLAHSAT